ncbi:MAG: Bug family tripartite tricarboxylate transporter substrate binding protein [Burkholderiales bacterium]
MDKIQKFAAYAFLAKKLEPLLRSFVALAMGVALHPAAAQAPYPSKQIHMIVPSVPGGANDTGARLTAPKLAEILGQPVIVENRAASGGIVGMNQVARAAPDGYTLIMVFDSFATNPFLFKDVTYNPVKDYTPVSLVGRSAQALAAHPSLGVKTLPDFVQLARSRGSELDWGTAGPGTSSRFSMELFKITASIEPTTINYKGGAPLINDLLGGQVKATIVALSVAYPHLRGGKLVPIAVTSARRSPLLPDVPTVAEVFPGFEAQGWLGLLGPAATPRPVVDRLYGAMVKVMAVPEVKAKFEALGYEVAASTPEEFGAWILNETTKWGRVIRERKITLD